MAVLCCYAQSQHLLLLRDVEVVMVLDVEVVLVHAKITKITGVSTGVQSIDHVILCSAVIHIRLSLWCCNPSDHCGDAKSALSQHTKHLVISITMLMSCAHERTLL